MQTLTIYVTTADLTMLNTILNGVAMICKQTAFIWGCAMLAAMWILLSTVTQATIAAVGGNAQGVLPKGNLSAIMPFIMAMLLTNPILQGNVQVESQSSGRVTVISNVPFIISVIPATGSILSQQAGKLVETAYQSSGTDYASISESGNGFINPLKVLLASRSAINRLNGIPSQISSVVTRCLPPDSGVNYSTINNLVSNAGNSGATAATSIPINGANPTAIGALLYQASLTTAYVPSIGTGQAILNCADAANAVATNIGVALQSVEFSRVVQGAVNGMDEPSLPANTQIDTITRQWDATRNAALVNGAIVAGSQQASIEVINLLMGELVGNELSCLSAAGPTKATCESNLVQANEIERNNIQFAAAEVPMLKYAGSFGNYLLALIIGLGPIVVMFMMFAGVNAGKCFKTVAHLIAWPLLVTNVGAELINGMMYISIANFAQSIAHGGVISFAENVAIYKELSFQIGSASHMMASLPVLMSMIFALGESAALVSVGSNIGPKGDNVKEHAAPTISNQQAVFAQSGMGGGTHTPEAAIAKLNGAMPMINAASQEGQYIQRASSTLQSALAKNKTKTENAQVAKDNAESVSTLNFKGWGFNDSDAQAFREQEALHRRESSNDQAGDHTSSTSDNEVNSQAHVGVSVGASSRDGLSVGVSAGGTTSAQAKSGLHKNYNAGHDDAINKSKDTSSVLERALHFAKTHDSGGKATKEISRRISAQQQYSESLTSNDSTSNTQSAALEQTDSITAYSAAITDDKLVAGMNRIPELGMYMNVEGQKMNGNRAVQKNLVVAKKDAEASATSDVVGDESSREGALLFRAAQLTSQDQSATTEDRLEARQFLAGALSTMMHGGVKPEAIAAPKTIDEKPENKTGKALPTATVPPATPVTSAHAHKHPSSAAPHSGQPPDKLTNATARFRKEFDKPLTPGFNPSGTRKSMDEHARSQGLGKDQNGTMHRVGTVITGAVADTAHEKGALSPVNYGEGGAVEARAAKRIADAKAKKSAEKSKEPVPGADIPGA